MKYYILKYEELKDAIREVLSEKTSKHNTDNSIVERAYISRKDVCELLKISYPTLDRLTQRGSLKRYTVGTKRYRYKKSDIIQYLEDQNQL